MTDDILERWELPDQVSDDQVRARYRSLVQRHHPDRDPSPAALELFIRIQEEYRQIRTAAGRRAVLARRCAPGSEDDSDSKKKAPSEHVVPFTNLVVRVDAPVRMTMFGGTLPVTAEVGALCKCLKKGPPRRSCKLCKGAGQVFEKKTFSIVVPPGTPPGKPLRCRGAGHCGTLGVGDLVVLPLWKTSHGWRSERGGLIMDLVIPDSVMEDDSVLFRHVDGVTDRLLIPRVPDDKPAKIKLPCTPERFGGFQFATVFVHRSSVGSVSSQFKADQMSLALMHPLRNLFGLNKIKPAN